MRFGPGEEGNCIRNIQKGDKVLLRPNGKGLYILDANFPRGEKTKITVDSGAEESVCPWVWGEQFEVVRPDKKLNLVNASGSKINHYGQRQVQVEALF